MKSLSLVIIISIFLINNEVLAQCNQYVDYMSYPNAVIPAGQTSVNVSGSITYTGSAALSGWRYVFLSHLETGTQTMIFDGSGYTYGFEYPNITSWNVTVDKPGTWIVSGWYQFRMCGDCNPVTSYPFTWFTVTKE